MSCMCLPLKTLYKVKRATTAGNMADLIPTTRLTPSHNEWWLAGLVKDKGYWFKTLGDGQGSTLMWH